MTAAGRLLAVAIVFLGACLATIPARADDTCTVRGTILGHDGKPMQRVRITPIVPGVRPTPVGADGRFALDVPCGCARALDAEAIHHQSLMIPVLPVAGTPIEFEARLRPLEWVASFDSVRVVTDFNRYASESAIPMTRQRDGTFAATIPCETESLRYQLLGVAKDGLPTAGTSADSLFFRRGRGVSSLRAGRKAVNLVFDPRRLPRKGRDATVRFADPRGASASVFPIFVEDTNEDERMSQAYRAHVAAGGDRDSFHWDSTPYLRSLKGRIPTEKDPLRRHYLLLCAVRTGGSDSLTARRALEEIPPESPLWGLAPGGPAGPLQSAWRAMRDSSLIRAYAEKGSQVNPDRDVRAGFLSAAMSEAEASGDKDRLGRYVTRIMNEFEGSYFLEMAQQRYGPKAKTMAGTPAPDFDFTALEDSSKTIRVADFRGRHLLIDFWAVWCGPCRDEMPDLHRAWEAYRDRGLAILSVSFDLQRRDVATYRKKWPMPWLHAFAEEGIPGKEGTAFGVWGIPKPILIGPDGTILAQENELRGEKLNQVLARALGEPASAAPVKK